MFLTLFIYLQSQADKEEVIIQHKSSTANFKTSKRKLNDLARLVAGRTADEALLQLQVSSRLRSMRGDEEGIRKLIELILILATCAGYAKEASTSITLHDCTCSRSRNRERVETREVSSW